VRGRPLGRAAGRYGARKCCNFSILRKNPSLSRFCRVVDCEALRQGGFRAKTGFFGKIKSLQHFRRFGEFRSENRSIGCRWGSGRLTVEAGWPDPERWPKVFRSSLICSQSESYKTESTALHRPLKKLTYLFGEPLASLWRRRLLLSSGKKLAFR
jgi:hypothetical protein